SAGADLPKLQLLQRYRRRLLLSEKLETRLCAVTADAGVLESPERGPHLARERRVDPDGASAHRLAHAHRSLDVAGPDIAYEPELGGVGDADCVRDIVEHEEACERAETLFLADPRAVGRGQNRCWRKIIATLETRRAAAADEKLGAFGFGDVDIAEHALVMLLERQRPHFGLWIERVADSDLGHALDEALNELIGDAALHQDARTGETLLAVIGVNAEERPVEGVFRIGVGEDDVGGLAAQLEPDMSEALSGGGHDRPAGLGAADELHDVDARIGHQRRAGHGSAAV